MIVGVAADAEARIEVPYSWIRRNRRLVGSHMGAAQIQRDIPALVDLYMTGRLPLDAIVSANIGLSHINDAVTAMTTKEAIRTVIDYELER